MKKKKKKKKKKKEEEEEEEEEEEVVVVVMTTLMTRAMKRKRIGRNLSCLVPVDSCFMRVRLIILPEV